MQLELNLRIAITCGYYVFYLVLLLDFEAQSLILCCKSVNSVDVA